MNNEKLALIIRKPRMDLTISYVLELNKKTKLNFRNFNKCTGILPTHCKNQSMCTNYPDKKLMCPLKLSLIKQEMNKTGNISNALKAEISGKSSISTKNS